MERNRIFSKITAAFAILMTLFLSAACGYAELPPRTSDATSSYLTPTGTFPTQEEKDIQKAAKDEYNSFINNQKQ
ncbi:MAG: hypothetical protein MJY67_01195 [Bacteroidales bacterium]|nr:hypothetical protein [Bacteroidales bacterium]